MCCDSGASAHIFRKGNQGIAEASSFLTAKTRSQLWVCLVASHIA